MKHDISGSLPPICPSCEIPIHLGTSHGSLQGCYIALKQYVKLCQDDIESSRMQSFQHPTREELLQELAYLAEQFEKFVIYTTSMHERIQKAQRGTLVG